MYEELRNSFVERVFSTWLRSRQSTQVALRFVRCVTIKFTRYIATFDLLFPGVAQRQQQLAIHSRSGQAPDAQCDDEHSRVVRSRSANHPACSTVRDSLAGWKKSVGDADKASPLPALFFTRGCVRPVHFCIRPTMPLGCTSPSSKLPRTRNPQEIR